MRPGHRRRLLVVSTVLAALGLGSTLAPAVAARPSSTGLPESTSLRDLANSPNKSCRMIDDLNILTPQELDLWINDDLEYFRNLVNDCQKAIKVPPNKLKTKRPKVPRTPGQPSFWLYVTGSQVAADSRSFALDDPEICSRFLSGGGFSFTSTKPGWAVFGPGPSAGGFGVITDINADVVNSVRLSPAGCDTSDATSGGDTGAATLEVSLEGIRLDSYLGGDLCDGRDCPSGWPSIRSSGDVIIPFTAKDRARIKDKRKGVLYFTADGGGAGGLYSPGACEGWNSGDSGYTCNWADSWSVTVVLIRADTLDFIPRGARR